MQNFEVISGYVTHIEHRSFVLNGALIFTCRSGVPVMEKGHYVTCGYVDGHLVKVRNHNTNLVTTYESALRSPIGWKVFAWSLGVGFVVFHVFVPVSFTGALEAAITIQFGIWVLMMTHNLLAIGHNQGILNEVDRLLHIKHETKT